MSKIGKISINIPEKVKVALAGSDINIEGPLGKQKLKINLEMFDFKIDDGKNVSIKPKKLDDDTKRLWGMNRSLINNAVIGSLKGYEKILELVGVGYRASIKGNQLNLQLGYSHDINFDIPDGIKIAVEKQTTLKISGFETFLSLFVILNFFLDVVFNFIISFYPLFSKHIDLFLSYLFLYMVQFFLVSLFSRQSNLLIVCQLLRFSMSFVFQQ